jgi:hypothetical protein
MNMKPGEPIFDFYADVMEVSLSRFQVSIGGEEVYPWLERLFAEFRAAGARSSSRWLQERLALEYKCVSALPNWLEQDSDPWPFYDGRPMVFIGQLPLLENKTTRDHLTWDAMVYVFGARKVTEHGYEIVYKEVLQSMSR